MLREIKILRKLTLMDNNLFTTKLYDVIFPYECNSSYESESDVTIDNQIFLVLDYVDHDLKHIF